MWQAILQAIARYLIPIIIGIFTGWFLFSAGQQVLTGVQYAAPGLGAMVGAMGLMFSMFPAMLMMFMMMSMMTMVIRAFE
jgi:hypothetical protein